MTGEQLHAAAQKLSTLKEATRWAFARDLSLVEVVTQDELTHDVVFAAATAWLVFDTT